MKILAIFVSCELIVACAAQPRATGAAAGADAGAGVKPLTTAAIAPVGTPAAAAPVAHQKAENSDVNQSYVKSGYKAVRRNGTLLYCRSEMVTGSLFKSTICLTDAQMAAVAQHKQDMVDELRNSQAGDCRAVKCN